MADKVKDANLVEKEVQVIHGDIYADSFRDRETGKEVLEDVVKRYHTNNIKNIGDEILDHLKCGDVVVKKTKEGNRNLEHCYIVSYYEHKHGCCLTYTAAGYIETQSYDYTDGHWVYNSQDLWQAE